MKIALIIPIYNVEKYLHRCLDSVLAQTFTDFECILVDDGSPDNCPAICDEYAARDSRFRVIHKVKNEGLPQARKSGLDIASTDYITHLDSDDWLDPEALELLYKKQQETDADIVMGGIRAVYKGDARIYTYPTIHKDIQPQVYFLLNNYKCIWGKLYKKYLFEECFIPTRNIGEDIIFNIQIFSKISIEKLQKIDNIIYNYDNRTNGMINSIKYDYTSFLDDPAIHCRLWVEQYIAEKNSDNSTKNACVCFIIKEGIIQYLKYNKNIGKDEVGYFYRHYYQQFIKSEYFKKIHILNRIVIPIYFFSILLGKLYVGILNCFVYICKSGTIFLRCIIRYLRNV